MDMTLFEVDEAANRIRAEVDPEANIIVGSTFNQELAGRVRVSVVATGIDAAMKGAQAPEQRPAAVAISKPWRETPQPIAAANPAPAPVPVSARAPAPAPASPVHLPPAQPFLGSANPMGGHSGGANPVGDVHERIRRMLIEGTPETLSGAPAPRRAAPPIAPPASSLRDRPALRQAEPQRSPRNPFRDATAIGKHSIEAALDIIKTISAPRAPDGAHPAPPPRPPEASRPPQPVRGDLFDDDADAELEIPSFLRKKKTGS
jgi:cell division protein FtsZ